MNFAVLQFPASNCDQDAIHATRLLGHMVRDKKTRDGKLTFVLATDIGHALTRNDVPPAAVNALLLEAGCEE